VKATHLTEVRTAIDAVRALANLSPAPNTDPVTAGGIIKAVHVTELRSAINEALVALSLSSPAYTDPSLTNVRVKAVHIQELRDAAGATAFGPGHPPLPKSVILSPSDTTISAGGTVQYTVTLDVPAVDTVTINLSVNPSNAGTLPATVTIPPNQTSTMFTYTDSATTATATITAFFGSSSSQATVHVLPSGHLVINEADYDQVGTDTAEFIEIFNPTNGTIDLTNKVVMLVNGANNAVYATIDLGPAGSLAAQHYLVIAGPNVTVAAGSAKLDPGWAVSDYIQNGSPDGIALVDNAAHLLIDALSYEGSITMATLTGFSSPVSLVEGTALAVSVADSNSVTGSLCRFPNGADTDDANTDWRLCTTVTPGSANQ